MPLKTLKEYMNLCREYGITPTWTGLRIYADLNKKKSGPTAEAMGPLNRIERPILGR